MKKIFLILLTLTNLYCVFAQYGGVFNGFFDKPQNLKLDEMVGIWYNHVYDLSKPDLKDYLSKSTYSFVKNNKLYIISYFNSSQPTNSFELNEMKLRTIYLYRLDSNKWNIASITPIRIDYYKRNNADIFSYDYYYPRRDGFYDETKRGFVKFLNNGLILLRMTLIKTCNVKDYPVFYTEDYLLTPSNNENYSIKKIINI
jgi:hypothetical protein